MYNIDYVYSNYKKELLLELAKYQSENHLRTDMKGYVYKINSHNKILRSKYQKKWKDSNYKIIEKNIKTAVDTIKEDIMIAQIVSENTVQQYKLIKYSVISDEKNEKEKKYKISKVQKIEPLISLKKFQESLKLDFTFKDEIGVPVLTISDI